MFMTCRTHIATINDLHIKLKIEKSINNSKMKDLDNIMQMTSIENIKQKQKHNKIDPTLPNLFENHQGSL
jgi:uncharacterized protein YcbK (DUF882 family)